MQHYGRVGEIKSKLIRNEKESQIKRFRQKAHKSDRRARQLLQEYWARRDRSSVQSFVALANSRYRDPPFQYIGCLLPECDEKALDIIFDLSM